MTSYLWVKLLHILSATIIFGTGIGTAYFMLRAYLGKDVNAFAETTKHVVTADWLFTTPAIIIQFLSGLWLTWKLGISFTSTWFFVVVGLYGLIGACWIPVVWIQIRIRDLAHERRNMQDYRLLMRIWIALGIPAFSGVLVLFCLMVFKYGAYS